MEKKRPIQTKVNIKRTFDKEPKPKKDKKAPKKGAKKAAKKEAVKNDSV
jgi:hypothetical protein